MTDKKEQHLQALKAYAQVSHERLGAAGMELAYRLMQTRAAEKRLKKAEDEYRYAEAEYVQADKAYKAAYDEGTD